MVRDTQIPFMGLYGACSTMAESLLTASAFVNAGYIDRAVAMTSSHFSTAERQFRMPMAYGGQRTPTAQWTATASGAVVLEQNPQHKIDKENGENNQHNDNENGNGNDNNNQINHQQTQNITVTGTEIKQAPNTESHENTENHENPENTDPKNDKNNSQNTTKNNPKNKSEIVVNSALIGKIVDLGVVDASNMGAAMAPAAAETIFTFMRENNKTPEDYDYIVTGDLGNVGSEMLVELLKKDEIDISKVHKDCGKMMYNDSLQDTHAGGSGCGCSASMLCGYFLRKMQEGEIKRLLFCATGALMSTTLSQQGESIPGICHLVEILNLS
jgi:3-oxoacyl-[acyl-carrier-protein] synthase III